MTRMHSPSPWPGLTRPPSRERPRAMTFLLNDKKLRQERADARLLGGRLGGRPW